jgi:hypothetical protein
MPDFTLDSLRGGFDDFTPITAKAKDSCTTAQNVEFYASTLGERRYGQTAVGLPGAVSADVLLDAAVWLFEHTPTKNESENELWAMTVDTDFTPHLYRRVAGTWSTIPLNSVSASDVPVMTNNDGYRIYGQSLHGKLYIAFHSGVDRLHVWDGTTLRRCGLAAPAVGPVVTNGAGGGTYAAVPRYYRVRFVVQSGATILRRSEPSASTLFTPDGAHDSASIARPTVVGEGETGWEVEASVDNAAFYRLVIVTIGTASYADFDPVTSYSGNVLSDPVGNYTLIPSVKQLLADDDRLLCGGSWTDTADGSAVIWTPVGNDPLPNPDERIDSTVDPRLDLDGLEGGDITNMGHADSLVIVTKFSHIYNLVRTDTSVGAYDARNLTTKRGGLPRSLVEAADERGVPATYFLDPKVGPLRIGSGGLQYCGHDIHNTWASVDVNSPVPCHGVYYAKKYQVLYWLNLLDPTAPGANPSGTNPYPNYQLKLQTNVTRVDDATGVRGGWSFTPTRSGLGNSRCSVMAVPYVPGFSSTQLPQPHVGRAVWTASDLSVQRTVVQLCDTTATTDSGPASESAYTAKVSSRSFIFRGLPNETEIQGVVVLGSAGSHVLVSLVKDYGADSKQKPANMATATAATHVLAILEDLSMAEMTAVRVEFEDDPANPSQWQLFQCVLSETPGQTG